MDHRKLLVIQQLDMCGVWRSCLAQRSVSRAVSRQRNRGYKPSVGLGLPGRTRYHWVLIPSRIRSAVATKPGRTDFKRGFGCR